MPSRLPVSLPALAAVLVALPATAQTSDDTARWLADCGRWNTDRETVCDVRETTVAARGRIVVDGGQNGGVSVRGWDRNEVRVVARMQANARSQGDAQALLRAITIETGGTIRALGPDVGRREGWSVSFDVYVPRRSDVEIETRNGGIRVADVEGTVRLDAVNGGVRLDNVAGSVRGATQNGGVTVDLAGDRWRGEGLDLRTQNGGVQIAIPERYDAAFETGTVNGRVDIDFPVTVSGRIGRTISTQLGRGGAPVRVTTQNGSVRVRRS